MSTLSTETVVLRDDTPFPDIRFAFVSYGSVMHVMVSRSKARCTRFLPRTIPFGLRRYPRYGENGQRLVCDQCVRAGLDTRTIRVVNA